MNNQKSSTIISIIALIISIIAIILSLMVFNCCRQHGCCKADKDQAPAVEQVAEAEAEEVAPAAEEAPATVADEGVDPYKMPADKAVKKQAATAPFIDLGLPSGTKWRVVNEEGMYSYADAVDQFGKQLPTLKQYTELYEKCKWQELKEGGYKVTGPNGKSIMFPLTGFINCTGEFRGDKEFGDYWTATKGGSGEAYRMVFNSKGVKLVLHTDCYQRAIRLVEK